MDIEDKLNLVKQVGEEIVAEDELRKLLESGEELVAYDGFEPSGQIHIAQGLLRAININKMIKAGIKFKMLVADWHALTNNKMGGDLEKIQTVGKYFIEVWRASGMDLKNVEFVWASEMVKNPDYWQLVIRVGMTNKLARFIRTAEFMGREDSAEKLTAAQIMYPCMQIADIFRLGAKITQLGMDQRKVNMLAREIGLQLGYWKPVVISHHMLMGLGKPPSLVSNTASRTIANKMSKSNPDSAIFMTDTTEDIKRKITKAYCLEGDVKENPVLEYCKYIIFESFDRLGINEFLIERPGKWGGSLNIKTYGELEKIFAEKQVHPQDLKNSVIKYLDQLLQPVRKHFEEDQVAKDLLKKVQSYQVSR
jgi:tyrosyl-tRNA synthetase